MRVSTCVLVSSGCVQRSPPPRAEGHDERGGALYPSSPAQRRDPQQGGARRTSPRPAGRIGLGQHRWRSQASSRRSRPDRDRLDLLALRRDRLGAARLAVVPIRRTAPAGLCNFGDFVAQSHSSHDRCVRFSPAVTSRTCNTRYRAARYALPGRDFHPLDRASFAWRTRCSPDP